MIKGQVPWNRGKKLSDKIRKNISAGKTGVHLQQKHKDRISESQRRRWETIREKDCSQCSSKHSKLSPIFKILIPAVSEHPLTLCEIHLVYQYLGLSQEDKKRVQIL